MGSLSMLIEWDRLISWNGLIVWNHDMYHDSLYYYTAYTMNVVYFSRCFHCNWLAVADRVSFHLSPGVCTVTDINYSKCLVANERELLEELALLNNTTTRRSRTRPKVQPATDNIEPEVGMVGEKRDEGEDQNDPWKKLKDFAGITWCMPLLIYIIEAAG
ncbi:hypothetical protein L3X38_016632 [Prunus dulcis]|uniref:Uncharacterized protein n=1 Tax=Prunus dulcis TaxID=3755 RepID=A0AAD4W6B9_PRUDU|nr:hypothetical protein L3X38_016632 [Prunus dulcis]